jgi:hypothetical protein
MQKSLRPKTIFRALLLAGLIFLLTFVSNAQEVPPPPNPDSPLDLKSLAMTVLQLQSQVQQLNSQVSELRAELTLTKEQLAAGKSAGYEIVSPSNASSAIPARPSTQPKDGQDAGTSLESRVSKLEDDQGLINDKVLEQNQTKVESGSKYRVRLSGIVLLNTAITRGSVDNLDFPQIATPPDTPGVSGAFSGSLRQSQIGIEAFGPDIAGAHTSANLKFDFAGGFPAQSNGTAFGIVRLRTGTIRLDWEHTSIVAGQDALFFAPLTPTTLSSLAIPALSYSGNLWSWTPQIRVEHRIGLTDSSSLLFQAGILDSLSGDYPQADYRYPTAGEQSGQPSYAGRIALSHRVFGRNATVGFGGYYSRQNWGYGRNIDGWAGITDLTLPLGSYFDFSAEFYRGRAIGGLGGGIGQSLLLSGPIGTPGTSIHGLDTLGGWAQLKFKPKSNFEVNFAYGQDNPFANELRAFPGSAYYYGYSLSRNLGPFVNFIYRVRSDVLFSVEYRRIQSYTLDKNADIANQANISVGYLF